MNRAVTIALGLLTVAWPLPWAPAWTYPLAVLGALAALPPTRAPVLTVATAITAAAFSDAPLAVLAAEGLFILACLVLADAPPALPRPAAWLRRQLPLLIAALTATAASLAALAVHPAASPWLTVAGVAAAVASYLITLPQGGTTPQTPQASMSSDASS